MKAKNVKQFLCFSVLAVESWCVCCCNNTEGELQPISILHNVDADIFPRFRSVHTLAY